MRDDYKPIIVFEFNMQNKGHKTKRIVRPLKQVLANIGGITRVALPFMVFFVTFLTEISHKATKLVHLSFNAKDLIRARKFEDRYFQLKLFCFRKLLCSSRLSKKLFDTSFVDLAKEFEKRVDDANEHLSIVHWV